MISLLSRFIGKSISLVNGSSSLLVQLISNSWRIACAAGDTIDVEAPTVIRHQKQFSGIEAISNNSIYPFYSHILLQPEEGNTDSITSIGADDLHEGEIITLAPRLDDYTITIVHSVDGIVLKDGANVVLSNKHDSLTLMLVDKEENLFYEVSRSIGREIPSGCIMMWSGTIASIPSGWALCNGQNGTPDLRDRFVVCASGDYAGTAVSSIQGDPARFGGKSKHRHAFSFSAGGATGAPVTGAINVASGSGATAYGASHLHTVSFSGNGMTELPNENSESSAIPPYYALAYIMKL